MELNARSIDRRELLERVEGDLDLLVSIIETFLARLPGGVDEIEAAAEERDGERLVDAAHRLKGSTANFARGRAYRVFGALEEMGKREAWHDVEETLDAMRGASEELEAALESIADEARSGQLREDA